MKLDEEIIEAQKLINSGMAWMMEGSIGRFCNALLEKGQVMLGTKGYKNFYGNYVPSRDEVKAGTKGSKQFVQEQMGEEYANELEKIN